MNEGCRSSRQHKNKTAALKKSCGFVFSDTWYLFFIWGDVFLRFNRTVRTVSSLTRGQGLLGCFSFSMTLLMVKLAAS